MTGHWPVAYFAFLYVAACLSALAGWVTHIVVCIKSASYLFLIAGAILPPIGVIHGYGVWLGAW
jgi:hypothetical protein